MTEAQTKKHWRCWARVVAANGWKMAGGRLVAPKPGEGGAISIYHAAVWLAAERLALREHCGVTADHLRHGCYLVATEHLRGFRKTTRVTDSSKELDNAGFSHLLTLWGDEKAKTGLLIEPDCLASQMAWEHPENDAAEGLDVMIARAAPDARLRAITFNATNGGTRDWQAQDAGFKRWLLRAVRVSALLGRNDWLLLSASLSARGEVCLGIAQGKPSKSSRPRLTPMQKWQQRHGARR